MNDRSKGFSIRVGGGALRFAAAHMATFGGGIEPMHGHNYAVTVEVEGALSEEGWVVDFGDVRRIAGAICKELDHRFVLQGEGRLLAATETASAWELSFGERRWSLPRDEVVRLPIDNSTAERLAEWFAGRLLSRLREEGARNVEAVAVEIEESPGSAGRCKLRAV